MAGRIGLSGCIQWLGERDAKQYYPAMDVFAISSRKEGLPYVVLEAMAAGLPVIATASSGVESLVIENENGTIVAPGDHAGFGVALRRLVCSESYRVSMGRGSLERVKQFSVQLMVKRTADLYVSSRRHGLFEQLVTHAGPRPESKYG